MKRFLQSSLFLISAYLLGSALAPAQVVISQVYGGGGNAGATLKNDFIEIFNRGNTPQSLNGWSVQYASATGSSWAVTNLTNVTLQPGQYYLIQEAVGAGGSVNLPTPDATGAIAMSATGAKVALANSTTALTGTCPTGGALQDLIGYNAPGGTGCSEGTTTAALTNTTAALRKSNGCTDTNNNLSDFTIGAPNPRNTASTLNACAASPLTIGTASPLPAGTINAAYTALQFSATGGSGTGFVWLVDSGSFPTNLSLSSGGVLSGTPNVSGTFSNIVVRVTDSLSNTTTATYSITISSASAPAISQNPQSQTIPFGQTATLTVVASGTPPLTYQWYQGVSGDTTAPVGTNSPSFTTPALTVTTNYWVRVTGAGSADSATAVITVTAGSTSPTGTGSAVLSIVPAGGTTQLTVNVTPGTNPASTNISVTGDLSAIGGSIAQAFPASGNTFSFLATVDAATALGAKTLPITVSDAQGRSTGFNISLTVTAPLSSSPIVISQVYGGGGNSGALYTNDYVQLYNRGNTTVDTSGWSLQYAPATGTGDWTGRQPLGGQIAPGQYYLIALASGGAIGSPLPPANVTGQINMAQGAGKVALVDNGDLLTGAAGCPVSTHLKDLVGYGSTANCWEGTGAVVVSGNLTTTALFRQGAGSIDTNDNKADFVQSGPPSPFTTAPIVPLPPSVFTTYPTTNDTDIPRDATIEVTFTQAVTVDPAWFNISCATTGAHNSATEAPDGNNRWITPNTNFVAGEACTVTVFNTKVHDAATGLLSPAQNYVWSFTVASGAAPPEPPSVHLLMGNPTNAAADINQPGNYLMSKPEFALSYNRDLGRPNWVSWHMTNAWIPVVHPARVDTFRPDPAVLPEWYRVQSFDFSGSGFDRGHMTPNADREDTVPDNQATFLMSNMVAQAPDNNQGPWADFENYLRTIVRSTTPNEIYIVSGPVGTGGTGSGGAANTIAGGHVTVPSSTWKVALVLPDNSSDADVSRVTCATTTIAVIMPNIQGIRSNPWNTYLTTVNSVETLTGYHFFTNLPQPIQNCIKAGTNGVNPKNDQTITFAPLDPATVGATLQLQASASSGLAVTLTVISGPGTIVNGNMLQVTGTGTVTVRATQAGDVNYNAAPNADQSVVVGKANQLIAFAALPDRTFGDASFTVAATGGASTQTVQFNASGACSVSANTVTINSAGSCTVTASQAGDGNYNAAADVARSFTINKAAQAAVTVNAPVDATFGQAGLLAAASGGSGTGAYSFSAAGSTACTIDSASGAIVITAGTGTCSITASRAGDTNYNASASSAAAVVNILKATATASAASSKNPSIFGDSVSFTAQVSPAAATGVVQFKIDGNNFGPPVALTNGSAASGAIALLTVSSHVLSAVYSGDSNFAGSTASLTEVVNQAATTSSVTPNVNPSVFGQAVMFTATVTGPGGIPTGMVTFKDGAASLGAVALDASGHASFATPGLVAGNHSITAAYGGDTNFIISTSAPLGQVVAQANTATSLTSSQNPSSSGQSVTFTATTLPVAPGAGIPTGGITFKDGTTVLGTMTLNVSGQAVFTTAALALGTHSITATYSGDANFAASASSSLSQQVFAFLQSGSFVIGDLEAVVGGHVTFTGSQWDSANNMSSGSAPSSFKGFADSTSTNPPTVGGTWTSSSGNSSKPPDSVPSYMAVLVSSSVTKSGSTITGNIVSIVIVRTDSSSGNTGTVVAIIAP